MRTGLLLAACLVTGWRIGAHEITEPPEPIQTPLPSWLDRTHGWTTSNLHERVVWLDAQFVDESMINIGPKPRSRFRLGMFLLSDLDDPQTQDVELDMSVSMKLPRFEEKMRLIVESRENEALPGTYPDEQNDSVQLALRRVGDRVDIDLGVKGAVPPVAFLKFSHGFTGTTGPVIWQLGPRLFYQTDIGFGTVAGLSQHRWVGDHTLVGHSSALRWTEETEGVEWEDSLLIGHVRHLVEKDSHGKFIWRKDIARGNGIRFSANGHSNGDDVTDRYRITLLHRRPLIGKDWLFLEVAPEVEWNERNNWGPEYILRVGFDMLFWEER